MKLLFVALLVPSLALGQSAASPKEIVTITSTYMDVPAVSYITPPSHPCNVPSPSSGGFSLAVCITSDEEHWKCADNKRVLLTSEDGVRHCILFPQQEPEVIKVTITKPSKKKK